MKKIVSTMLILIICFTCYSTAAIADGVSSNDIVVLFTNDVHCAVDSNLGYAGLAAYKKHIKTLTNNVTLVDAGDWSQGGPIGTLSKGEYLVDIMNYVGYDIVTLGNHEFDYTIPQLKKLSDKATFSIVDCNFTDLTTNTTVYQPYKIIDYGSKKVAFIGITTPETITSSTPTYFQDEKGNYIYDFCQDQTGEKLYSSVQSSISNAKQEGADYVVAVGHTGVDQYSSPWRSTDIIKNTTDIDAYIDGHSHSTVANQIVTDKNGNAVVLSQTGTGLNSIGQLIINADGNINTSLVSDYTEKDTETTLYINSIKESLNDVLNKNVANSDVDLIINDPETNNRIIRISETNLGDLCADAYKEMLGADIGLMNGGGIRAKISKGDITYNDIISVFPFNNNVCMIEATGQQILDALEMGARYLPTESGSFLHVSGLKYKVNTTIPSSVITDSAGMFLGVGGKYRVNNVEILSPEGTYSDIDKSKTYRVASHEYMLLNSGDGMAMFAGSKILKEKFMTDSQMLIEFITNKLNGKIGEDYSNLFGQGRIIVSECKHSKINNGICNDCGALIGDANNDKQVNIKDVLAIRKYLVEKDFVINENPSDLDSDLKVTMSDLLILRKFLAAIIAIDK